MDYDLDEVETGVLLSGDYWLDTHAENGEGPTIINDSRGLTDGAYGANINKNPNKVLVSLLECSPTSQSTAPVLPELDNMKLQAALLAVFQAGLVACQTNGTTAPSEVPYYGISPAVYPTRKLRSSSTYPVQPSLPLDI